MNALNIPRSTIVMLATLAMALALTMMPKGPAFADEAAISILEVESHQAHEAIPMDTDQLRRLLSKSELNVDEQVELDRALDQVLEELADASDAAAEPKSFIQSVNDLLGIKTTNTRAHG